MMESIAILVLLAVLFVAHAIGRWLGKKAAEKNLAKEKSDLCQEKFNFWAEVAQGRAARAAEKRENEDTAKALEQKRQDLEKQKTTLMEREQSAKKSEENKYEAMRAMEQEINRAGKKQRAALEKEKEDFENHRESVRQQHEFIRNYFLRRSRVDAYIGQDALQKCGGVYVISRQDGLVKVGMTEDDFSRRFEEVRRDCERAGIRNIVPEILVPMDEGISAIEKEVHKRFPAQREGGEWFRVPVEEAVKAVLSAAWQQHLRNTKGRKYLEPPDKGEDESRGDSDIPCG